jgi:hypothetical protein
MAHFRKKPVVIEAFRWTGGPDQNEDPVWAVDAMKRGQHVGGMAILGTPLRMQVFTLEGVMNAAPGDYIIKGVKGELYPCKPDIFEATYEPVHVTDVTPQPA